MADIKRKWSETKPATVEIALMACMVQNKVQEITKKTYETFVATEYKEISNNLPWPLLIKVQVDKNQFISLRLRLDYDNLECPLKISVIAVNQDLVKGDPFK